MTEIADDSFAGLGIKHFRRLVPARGDQTGVIGVPRNRVDPVGVAAQFVRHLAGLDVDQPQFVIRTAGSQPFAIVTERHGKYHIGGSDRNRSKLAAGQVEQPHLPQPSGLPASHRKQPTVG